MRMLRRLSRWRTSVMVCVVSLLLITGCSDDELYSSLSQQQANEMVALLYGAGLPAKKQRNSDTNYSILISNKHFAQAVNLLNSHGLPRAGYDTIGEVFAKEGFVSSPLEERARLNHAMTQEIAHTISSIDGVLLARVHLAVPEKNELSDEVQLSSASVFVKHRADVDLTASVTKIKAIVVNGIENLPYEQVTVALFSSQAPVQSTPALHATSAETLDLSVLPKFKFLSIEFIGLGAIILVGLLLKILFGRGRLRALFGRKAPSVSK